MRMEKFEKNLLREGRREIGVGKGGMGKGAERTLLNTKRCTAYSLPVVRLAAAVCVEKK